MTLNINDETVLKYQFDFAWEHFRFHADQRVKVFNFFLVTSALLINAFSLLSGSDKLAQQEFAFIPLFLGGILSTVYLGLDVRNTQLLEQSETVLRKIEHIIFRNLEENTGSGLYKVGILSRERILKNYDRANPPFYNPLNWIWRNKIKHKALLRGVLFLSVFGFFTFSIGTTPADLAMEIPFFSNADVLVVNVEIFVVAVFVFWCVVAVMAPGHDLKREVSAWKWAKENQIKRRPHY